MAGGIKSWLRWGLSAGLLLALLLFMVDLDQAAQVLRGAKWGPLGLMILLVVADRVVMSYKWRLLLVCRGMRIGHWEALRSYFLATFAGCFLPSTVGADALRIYAVSGPERPSAEVTASVVVERAVGFVAAALAALLGLVLLSSLRADLPRSVWYWAVALAVASAAAVIFSLSKMAGRLQERMSGWLDGKGKLGGWLGGFMAAYQRYRDHGLALSWFFLLTFLEQGAPVVGNWLAAWAFGIQLSFLQALAVTPVAILLARMPISVSAFGVMEGLYVAFFSLVGVGPTEAFILGLTTNLATLVSSLPGLAFYARGGLRRGGA